MTIGEARLLRGQYVKLAWQDRHGEIHERFTVVDRADFVPLYGPCLITEEGEVCLDRVVSCETVSSKAA